MRIIFMGSPPFAVPTLDALIEAGHEIVAVYCQPPRRAGRGKELRQTAVQAKADAAGLLVRYPTSLRDPEVQREFAALDADVAVVAAYGLLLPEAVLKMPRRGCFNVHGSLLPRWRGAAPIQRAIMAGDVDTGITIMGMERGLDTGPSYAMRATPIAGKTAGDLFEELSAMGAAMMVEVLGRLDQIRPVPQPARGATYAAKIKREETRLAFDETAKMVERRIRAFNPAPGAWFEHSGERIRVIAARVEGRGGVHGTVLDDRLTIACAAGSILPTIVQRAGRAEMTPAELLRGFPIPAGTRLA